VRHRAKSLATSTAGRGRDQTERGGRRITNQLAGQAHPIVARQRVTLEIPQGPSATRRLPCDGIRFLGSGGPLSTRRGWDPASKGTHYGRTEPPQNPHNSGSAGSRRMVGVRGFEPPAPCSQSSPGRHGKSSTTRAVPMFTAYCRGRLRTLVSERDARQPRLGHNYDARDRCGAYLSRQVGERQCP
jgi:hypothetical protein